MVNVKVVYSYLVYLGLVEIGRPTDVHEEDRGTLCVTHS